MEEDKPSYYAIIPAVVRYDNRLKDKSKLLYGEITALSTKEGKCWASNDYFAKLYGTSTNNISKLISELVEYGYINREIIYKEGSKEISARYLQIPHPIGEINNTYWRKLQYPIGENDKDNNTSINNTSINIKENSNIINNITKRKVNRFVKPTLEEIENYIKEKNLNVDSKQFFEYFEEGDWIDSKGNKVKNWKQKLLTWNKFKTGNKRDIQESFKKSQEASRERFLKLMKEKGYE